MEKKNIVLKLGGSLLTDKSSPYTLRENTLKRVAQEIKECIELGLIGDLVIINGVGSFGHPPVLEHNLQKGFRNKEQLIELSKTQHIVNLFRNKISKCLLDVGIPINLMHTSSIMTGTAMKITDYSLNALKGFLSLGMVPLIGGDMMYDEKMGFSVCSGDQIATLITREIGADTLIFATDVPGIYDKDPNFNSNAVLIKKINVTEIEQLLGDKESSIQVDASGGMKGKLMSLFAATDISKKGLKVFIISMMKSGTLKSLLQDQIINMTEVIFN